MPDLTLTNGRVSGKCIILEEGITPVPIPVNDLDGGLQISRSPSGPVTGWFRV